MSFRFGRTGLFILALGSLVPGALAGQAGQDSTAQFSGDSLTLAFEREVFTYPDYIRRNPFKSLLGGDEGPRFESLLLLGILYSPFAGESIALFGEGTRSINPGTVDAPESTTVELTGGTYRVREGATLGNLTVRSIERLQVTVQLVEFGITETRTMFLPRGTSGQGGPK